MANTAREAKKQGLAWWEEGSFVEISLNIERLDKKGLPYWDPNTFRARCLTTGTWVKVEVLNAFDEPHEEFPDALLPKEFSIWKVIPPRVYNMKNNDILVIVGNGRYPERREVYVIRKGTDDVVKEGFGTVEEARDWIALYDEGEEFAEDEVEFSF